MAVIIVAAYVGYIVWVEIRGQRMWVVSQHQYEGFPLLLRRVERLPFPSRRRDLPVLAVITHTFAKRLANGLPEPDYDDSLCELDLTLMSAMRGIGSTVLIETFGGKRHYYYYVSDSRRAELRFRSLKENSDCEELTIDCRPDATWDFIYKYFKHFFPDQLWMFDPLPSKADTEQ